MWFCFLLVIKEEAFAKAIISEKTAPLSETFDPNAISLSKESYDGPNPIPGEGPTDDMELEASMFEPGNLPREFVMVRSILGLVKRFVLEFGPCDVFPHFSCRNEILITGCNGTI